MFVDYYALLEVSQSASSDEIKSAFKKQALKWHPDRNAGMDTTAKMQLLNEAKLILLDVEAREKYDYQYLRFKQFKQEKARQQEYNHKRTNEQQKQQQTHKPFEEAFSYSDFSVDDDVLKKWMANARRQAVDLAKQTIEDLKGMTKAGVKAGAKAMGNAFIYQIIFGVIILIIFGISKGCNA